MSTKTWSTTPATDGGASAANPTGQIPYGNTKRCYGSGANASTKFVGKTSKINGNIFDVGAGQGTKFIATNKQLSEYMARTNTKGHHASSEVQTVLPINYNKPDEPTRMVAGVITVLSELKI